MQLNAHFPITRLQVHKEFKQFAAFKTDFENSIGKVQKNMTHFITKRHLLR